MSETSAVDDLIKFWGSYRTSESGSQLHEEDEKAMYEHNLKIKVSRVTSPTLKDFLGGARDSDSAFHLSLSPVPYVGCLKSADIFLFMLNPSLGAADYGTEEEGDYQKILARTRAQQVSEESHKCFALNPAYWWTSWFAYYERLLRNTLWEYVSVSNLTYSQALQELSNRLAILELVPYYSARGTQITRRRANLLPSAIKARAAGAEIAKKAASGSVTVIVRWGQDKWKLDQSQITAPESTFGLREIQTAIVKRLRSV